jgi:hypothetical protein
MKRLVLIIMVIFIVSVMINTTTSQYVKTTKVEIGIEFTSSTTSATSNSSSSSTNSI